MWSPASMRIVSASECSRRLRFRRTASAVPRYHSATRPRAMYRGRSLTPPLVRSRSHGRPRPMWSLSERGLYCVRTTTSLISELTQLDSVKSMIRYLPPNGTAGLARTDERIDSRSPSPPALTIGLYERLSTWAYHVSSSAEWAITTIQAFGLRSYGLGPAKTTTPAPAALIGVYSGAAT